MSSIVRSGIFLLVVIIFLVRCTKKENLNTVRKPIAISGTNVSIVPPPGFKLATDIPGFRHDSLLSSIIVLETPKPYNNVMTEINKEKLAEQGVELLSIDTVSIADLKGTIYSSFSDGFTQWMLVLPVEGHTVMVNGTFSATDHTALSSVIRHALLSTRIVAQNDSNTLDFKIDSDTLKFAKMLAGPSVIFTRDGKWTDSSIFDLSFFAGPFNVQQAPLRLEEFTLNQLSAVCADCEVTKNGIQPVTVDSLDGYEVVAHSKDSSGIVKRLKYQVVLFDSMRYYLLVGTSTENSDSHLEMFKAISRSFRKKS